MNDLQRELAPITTAAWKAIDAEAKSTLELALVGRRVADFVGPLGWDHSAVGLGRTEALPEGPGADVSASRRLVQPLVELRVPFALRREELDAIGRGARDPDLQPVVEATRAIALAEDRSVFHGYGPGGIQGICEAAGAGAPTSPADFASYPGIVVGALTSLRTAGVEGPYAMALGPRSYTGITETFIGGYPVIRHVQRLLEGPVFWASAVDGAVVVSLRGGDFELVVGRDFSVGYHDHTSDTVELYIEESFTFRVLAPEAAVPILPEG